MELWQAVFLIIIFAFLFIAGGKSLYQRGYDNGKWSEYPFAWQDGFNSCNEFWASIDSLDSMEECNCEFCQEVKKARQN